MIPQAIASCGPYADLWAHLKAMIHAVRRAKTAKDTRELTVLDRERLEDVRNLIKSEMSHASVDAEMQFTSLVSTSDRGNSYTFGTDLHKLLKENVVFEKWSAPQKLGMEKKLQKLQSAVGNYLQNLPGNWVNSPPKEELSVIEAILESLLSHTESSLQV